ncbi:MAG: class I SAM-dependent methyltransferase, partial [Pseudomonadota bacterium]
MSDFPRLRLKPKTDPRRLRHGFPWVYANEVVTDRRTKSITPGTVAVLEDNDRTPIALVAVNTTSKIIGRVLDNDLSTVIDTAWFATRIAQALALRDTLYDSPYYRLIHAEADGLPGVIVDRFADVLVVQPNAAWADTRLNMLVDALVQETGAQTVLMNGTGRARILEGLPELREPVQGNVPSAPVPVPMNGATYMADLAQGQKTGLFYDQRPNHAFAQKLAAGARVLDVFSHVGGFGLAARAAGAAHVTCVDGSQPALDLAQLGADATHAHSGFATL